MHAQVIHHDDLSLLQARNENMLDVGFKSRAIGCPFDDHGSPDPFERQGGYERRILAPVAWHAVGGPLPFGSPCIQRRQRNVGPTLIDKDPLPRLALLHLLAPTSSFLLVAFAGCQRLFFRVQPSRWIMRLIVEVLTPMPCSLSQS